MITVACLATILFFGGWLSPFPQTPAFAWTRYLPTALFGHRRESRWSSTASATSRHSDASFCRCWGWSCAR